MIGIFGGTFDPVHYGHLRPALEAQQALGLEQVRFVPLAHAVHRDQPRANASQRLEMLQAAVAGQPGFYVDDREIRRAGPSYTLDTLTELRAELPTDRLALFVGGDAFNDFLTWHRPLDILSLAHLLVLQRPVADRSSDPELTRLVRERQATDAKELRRDPAGRILFLAVTQLDISATAIRELIAARRSPRFLLPDAAIEIIERGGLYRRAANPIGP
jgi:nicotinate-nucleotide adenylyltransferase